MLSALQARIKTNAMLPVIQKQVESAMNRKVATQIADAIGMGVLKTQPGFSVNFPYQGVAVDRIVTKLRKAGYSANVDVHGSDYVFIKISWETGKDAPKNVHYSSTNTLLSNFKN